LAPSNEGKCTTESPASNLDEAGGGACGKENVVHGFSPLEHAAVVGARRTSTKAAASTTVEHLVEQERSNAIDAYSCKHAALFFGVET